ncbi:EF-hand domain-containing protein [Sphingomonas sp.]|uniref:EF-hand domain-containing protein n=1 Tax=Sphingomonas sp. TaxID=28214 RepID=UPI0035BC0F7C
MWRYLVGAVAALMLAGAGMLLFGARARTDTVLPAASTALAQVGQDGEALPATMPEASAKTREEKRFGRYDKDRDGKITRDEYLVSRRKAYAKLDVDHDGKLSFDEWSAKTLGKFATADRDKSGAMSAGEFATTAVVRKTKAVVKCPPVEAES